MDAQWFRSTNINRLRQEIAMQLQAATTAPADLEAALESLSSRAERVQDKLLKLIGVWLVIDMIMVFKLFGSTQKTSRASEILPFVPDVDEAFLLVSAFLFYVTVLGRMFVYAVEQCSNIIIQHLEGLGHTRTAALRYAPMILFVRVFSPHILHLKSKIIAPLLSYLAIAPNNLVGIGLLLLHFLIHFFAFQNAFLNPNLPNWLSDAILIVAAIFNISAGLVVLQATAIRYRFIIPKNELGKS